MQTIDQSSRQFPQPLDRAAIGLILILSVLIGILLLSGDRSMPRIRDFSWQNKQIGADDNAFVMTFSRPMDHKSVEENLRIEPTLPHSPGKISWSGRRMAYTLNSPAPYGSQFQVSLSDARDAFTKNGSNRATIAPFKASFRTRDRVFAYIGAEGDQAGRLVLFNLTTQDKKILTPQNLTVMDFKPYSTGDKILFSAIDDAAKRSDQAVVEQKLYTVTTGVQIDAPKQFDQTQDAPTSSPAQPGQVALVLDNQDYQNLKFDLSADGQVIVVQRLNRRDPADSGTWMIRGNAAPQALGNKQPAGDFLITPDSDSVAIAQGQGLAIVPLTPQAEALDFLPKFGTVLSFSPDGTTAAMVKFNTDYTRSLFIVSQGVQKEVLKITGSILSAQFDPTKQILYCLLTNLTPGNTYQEQPYLATIDLAAALKGEPQERTMRPIVLLPMQREILMSLAPDGRALIFDQTRADDLAQAERSAAIANSRLWILPLTGDLTIKAQPQPLLSGFHPRWLP